VTLTVTGDSGAGGYQQDSGADGIVSIEAENSDVNLSQGGHTWVPVSPAGYSGTGAMQAQPNSGTNNNTGYVTNSPRLDYEVNFVHTGTHYVWIRGLGANDEDDSVHVGLDGVALSTSDRITNFNPTWTWSKATIDGVVATVNVATTGVHTVNVWMREDGFVIDKLVLTISASYIPTGTGPAESPRSGNALVFSPDALTFTVEEGATTPSQTTDLDTSDSSVSSYAISDDGAWLTVSPTSGDTPDTLTVSIDATGLTPGTYTATITATASGYTGDTVGVTLTVTGGAGAYQQDSGADGIVSIEAENSDVNLSQGGHTWVPVSPAGYSGTGAMQAQPNSGTNNNTGYVTNSPRLDYEVNFVHTGTHYVWIRGLGANDEDDSVHVGLDGVALSTSDRITNFNPTWTWSKATIDGVVATVNVATTGVHTVNVWMREDGFVIDKLVLTISASYIPTGTGPAESPRSGNALVFSPDALTFTVEEGATTPSQTTDLDTSDSSVSSYAISDDGAWLTVSPTSGDTPDTLTVSIAAAGLTPGTYTATITATASGYTDDTVGVTLTVTAAGTDLLLSPLPDRSNAVPLDGETLSGLAYVFVNPGSGGSRASFYVDDMEMNGAPYQVDNLAPFDFMGTDQGVFGDVDGIIPIETEHFYNNVPQGGHYWADIFTAGYSGEGAMRALPNTAANNNTGYVSNSPRLDFNVDFPQAGTYYVWLRGIGATDDDDSVHVGLDGNAVSTSDRIAEFSPNWTWSNKTMDGPVATMNIPSPGFHTTNIWMREDGFIVDKLILTPNSTCSECTGTGPDEHPYAKPFNTTFLSNGSHTITVMLELPGGATNIVHATFTVNNGITSFLFDEFADGNADGWIPVNDDGYSSAWQVVDGKYLQQETIINPGVFDGSYHLGKYSLFNAGTDWIDYRFSVYVTPLALMGDGIGVMFRYQDNDNYYRLSMSARYGYTRLEKKVDGIFTPIYTNSRGYLLGQELKIEVEVKKDFIFVYIDDDPVFSIRDSSLSSGGIALYTRAEAEFDDVTVETVSEDPAVIISSPIAHSVTTFNTIQATALAINFPADAWVDFLLDGGSCGDAVEISEGVYTVQCSSVLQGDHILTAALKKPGSQLAVDINEYTGTSGDYFVSAGDSITNGREDTFSFDNISLDERIISAQGFEANLSDLLTPTNGYPTIVFNEGIGGDESYDAGYTRIASILDRHPASNKVLVLLGTNDAAVSILSGLGCSGSSCDGTYKQNMQLLINTIVADGKSVYVALVPPAFTAPNPLGSARNILIQQYNTVINTELTNIELERPDFFSFFLNASDNRFSLFADEIHPNSLGYVVMAYLWHNAITGETELPFILEDLTPSTVAPFLKQNLLEIGDVYYVDESYVLTGIPPGFEDGRWIMTANSDKANSSSAYLSFSVDRSVTVYVAYDAGATSVPNWLSNNYHLTGLQIGTSNVNAPIMDLYESDSAMSGAVSLGGNLAAGASGALANYIVIVMEN
jgi:lysophospholipase L1-like esterase